MAKINIEEARKLAKLSRLEFSEDELKNFVQLIYILSVLFVRREWQ